MISERYHGAVVVWAPAKVNLYLEVLGKRPDGYHEIATLMVAVNLYDTLEFDEDTTGTIALSCDQPGLTTGPENLIVRAADLLRRRRRVSLGARIRLRKRIPMAAGLAGGSSDAAAALAGLNELWRLHLSQAELAELGGELGSDVPFFFVTPAAWCTGRGERVEAVAMGKDLWFVVACPPMGLSTAEVYRDVAGPGAPQSGDDIRRAVETGRVQQIGKLLHNRLEASAQRLYPTIAKLRRRLEELRPAGQLMSGSGSTVFALCSDEDEGIRLAHELRHGPEEDLCPNVFLVRSCF
jgi:4-diphosphocytidyl-2-C-methyl-D-erythritol kinase